MTTPLDLRLAEQLAADRPRSVASRTQTSAAAKQSWPMPRATPKLTAPRAAAIAVPIAKAPSMIASWRVIAVRPLAAVAGAGQPRRDPRVVAEVPRAAAARRGGARGERADAGEDDAGQVDAELRHRAAPVGPVAERRGDADVGGGGDRRHRDQHPDQRPGLGRGQREHPGRAGEAGDDDREGVRLGDELGQRVVDALEVGVDQAGRDADQGEQEGGGDPDREADRERDQRAQGDVRAGARRSPRRGRRAARTRARRPSRRRSGSASR